MTRRAGYTIGAVSILALFTYLGARSAIVGSEFWPQAAPAQRAVIALQWAYVACGILAVAGLAARHTAARPILLAWAVLFTARSALAPVVTGGTGPLLGIAGGVIGLGIALAVLYLDSQARRVVPAPPGS